MPRLRRRPKTRRSPLITDRTIDRLKTGCNFWFLDGDEISEEELHQAWEEIGSEILQEWIREKPGQRPSAWWLFEAPEPRRLMDAGPGILGKLPDRLGQKGRETQLSFLERHGLLAPWEKEGALKMAIKEWNKRNDMRCSPRPESERSDDEFLLRQYDSGTYF